MKPSSNPSYTNTTTGVNINESDYADVLHDNAHQGQSSSLTVSSSNTSVSSSGVENTPVTSHTLNHTDGISTGTPAAPLDVVQVSETSSLGKTFSTIALAATLLAGGQTITTRTCNNAA